MVDCVVAALLYGEYSDLHERCLLSIRDRLPRGRYELRVGVNAVPPKDRTWQLLSELTEAGYLLDENIYSSHDNIHKYPMMRRLFHDPSNRIEAPFVMWLDDDSYFTKDFSHATWDYLVEAMESWEIGMVGSRYHIGLQGNQRAWIEDQPWYNNVVVGSKVEFCTGGWWCLQSSIIEMFDWPVPALDHRGGDTMLGALMAQHGIKIHNYATGVAINADENGRESKAQRRGFDSKPIGFDYDPGITKQIQEELLDAPPVELIAKKDTDAVPRIVAINSRIAQLMDLNSRDLLTLCALYEGGDSEFIGVTVNGMRHQVSREYLGDPLVSTLGKQVYDRYVNHVKPLVDEAVQLCERTK